METTEATAQGSQVQSWAAIKPYTLRGFHITNAKTGNTGSALQRGLSADSEETTYETCPEEPDGKTCRVKWFERKTLKQCKKKLPVLGCVQFALENKGVLALL